MNVTVFHNVIFGLLVIPILLVATSNAYFLSNDSTIWGEINCTLAVPDLNFTDEGIYVVNDDVSVLSLPSEGAWIGLYKARLSYSYVGCNTLNDTDVLLVRNLSDCRWQSGCDMFGVRKTDTDKVECKCLKSSVTKEKECTSMCGSEDKYPCGSIGNSYFSIYTIENVSSCSVNCNNVATGCLGVRFDKVKKVRWWLCSRPWNTSILCSRQPYNEPDGQIEALPSKRNKTWANTGQKCLENGLFPTPFRHIQSINLNETNGFWTSVIRMESLLSVDDNFATSNPMQYAYIKCVQGELKVGFDGELTKQRTALCRGGGVTTTMQTTTSKYTSTKESEDQTTQGHVYTTHTSTSERSTPYHETKTRDLTSPTSSSLAEKVVHQSPITVIAASVSSGVLLVTAVVMVILWKRGTLHCFRNGKNVAETNESIMQDFPTEAEEPKSNTHPNAYLNDGYSMCEDLTFSSIQSVPVNDEHMYANGVAKHINPGVVETSHTVYNDCKNGQRDENYDHMNSNDMPKFLSPRPVNDYDSMTTYKTKTDGNSEETYNHLNEPLGRVEITDNVYGFKGNQEPDDEYDTTFETTMSNTEGRGDKGFDEYDEINRKW